MFIQIPKYDRIQRIKWYLQVDKYNKTVKEVCQIFGISRKCYYKWRLRDYSLRGNTYNPARSNPNLKLTWEVRKFIEHHKLISNYGPKKMKLLVKKELDLDVSTTIIYRYYQKRKLIRCPQRKLSWYQPMKEKITVTKPGEAVQLDVKYVYFSRFREYQFSVFYPYTKKTILTFILLKKVRMQLMFLREQKGILVLR